MPDLRDRSRTDRLGAEVRAITPYGTVHEVVFRDPRESPHLKFAKCQELGIEVFSGDRDDVCRVLNSHGILAMRVTRRGRVDLRPRGGAALSAPDQRGVSTSRN